MSERKSVAEMAAEAAARKAKWDAETGGNLYAASEESIRSFWDEKIAWKDDVDTIRVNRCHYRIGPEDAGHYRGFGGARFIFERLDTGERIVSTNVWYQGEIPTDYDEILPDNARSITND